MVELVDSLDSGSSVHCGRAGSSPASPTKKTRFACLFSLPIPFLTFTRQDGIFLSHGELSERFKEPVLKTGDPERDLGFESLTLRQKATPSGVALSIVLWDSKNILQQSGGLFLSPWENPCISGCIP